MARTCYIKGVHVFFFLLKISSDTVVLKFIQPPDIFPLTSIVNMSCNIECCVNSMLPINQNMIVSQALELILSMFRTYKDYYIRSASINLGMGPKFSKLFNPLLP